jgi:hypothetical protein
LLPEGVQVVLVMAEVVVQVDFVRPLQTPAAAVRLNLIYQ